MKLLIVFLSAISVLTAETCDWNTKITHVYDPARVLTPADKSMIERELAKAPVPSYIAVFPNPSKEHVHDTVFGDVVRSKADECKIAQRNGRMEILLAVRPSRNRQDIETYWDVEAGGKYLWDKLTENGGINTATPFRSYTQTRKRLTLSFSPRSTNTDDLPAAARSTTVAQSALSSMRELWGFVPQKPSGSRH